MDFPDDSDLISQAAREISARSAAASSRSARQAPAGPGALAGASPRQAAPRDISDTGSPQAAPCPADPTSAQPQRRAHAPVEVGLSVNQGPRPRMEDWAGARALDSWGSDPRSLVIATVHDGVGSRPCGGAASAIVGRGVLDGLTRALLADPPASERPGVIASVLRRVNRHLVQVGDADEQLRGLASTGVTAVLHGQDLCICWAGDSPALLLGKDGLRELTAEDVNESGEVTQYFGNSEGFQTRSVSAAVEPGDVLLLATDGVSKVVTGSFIREAMSRCRAGEQSSQACAEALVFAAIDEGTTDNCTAFVLRVGT